MHWVYILTNKSNSTLYVGVTRNIKLRIAQHRPGDGSEFVKKYNLKRLVYAESCDSAMDAIEREKQIKRWRREKKDALIEERNPRWREIEL
ncbi:MAG: GIY-YIG nuclease family protein [Pseudomonadales bacterium]|nr:GIY-YIG nuclease family protein [Pseudomonadales bacterium]